MVLFNLLQKPFAFLQITEYILQVSMLCISFENSNKYCLTEGERFKKLQSAKYHFSPIIDDPTVVLSSFKDQDQDQDSLLVKRRNDNHSPGPVIRELVPSSHQRSELSNTILCIFSG